MLGAGGEQGSEIERIIALAKALGIPPRELAPAIASSASSKAKRSNL